MKPPASLPAITPEDPLARHVFSRRRAERAQRLKVQFDLFLPQAGSTRLSVDRLGHVPDIDMATIGRRVAEASGKSFFGWVIVVARDAQRMGRWVEESPLLDNPFHADIVLPLGDRDDARDQVREHAYDLARRAHYRGAP